MSVRLARRLDLTGIVAGALSPGTWLTPAKIYRASASGKEPTLGKIFSSREVFGEFSGELVGSDAIQNRFDLEIAALEEEGTGTTVTLQSLDSPEPNL